MWVTKTEAFEETRGSANHRDGTPFSVRVVGPACATPGKKQIQELHQRSMSPLQTDFAVWLGCSMRYLNQDFDKISIFSGSWFIYSLNSTVHVSLSSVLDKQK